MFWVFIIILVIGITSLFVYISYMRTTKGKSQLNNVEVCITRIEKEPSSSGVFDELIEILRVSQWIQIDDFYNGGCYDRILKICEQNSSNVKAWQILGEVIQKLNLTFRIDLNNNNRKKIFRLLVDSLFKEFRNQPIRDKILSLVHRTSGITPSETQDLYNTSLKILEANPNSQEAKMLVLDVGRWRYSIIREDKKPTIYDEQAIQNDIMVRSK